jgi:hypothetical protein
MAKITEVTNKWELQGRFTDWVWVGVSQKLNRFRNMTVYMIELELGRLQTVEAQKAQLDTIVPWLNEHAGIAYIDWMTHSLGGLCFIKDHNVALQFYLTFGSAQF